MDLATPEADLIGRPVGNYTILKQIGKGGMGQVFLAEHPRIGRRVAVKVLSREMANLPMAAERFEAEARAITQIQHANIIDIYDFGSLPDGRLYYVMELLSGVELANLLKARGKMSAQESLPFVTQLCDALQAAHDRGVIHRDLKPENIFILQHEPVRLKILDFGIAKLLEQDPSISSTSTGQVMGTPQYIAPEQAAGDIRAIGPATDLYSLGVILYRMLAGVLPFTDRTAGMLITRHITAAPPPIRAHTPELPLEVARMVHWCLEKDPSQRPASAQVLADAFVAAVDHSVAAGGEGGDHASQTGDSAGGRLRRISSVELAVAADSLEKSISSHLGVKSSGEQQPTVSNWSVTGAGQAAEDHPTTLRNTAGEVSMSGQAGPRARRTLGMVVLWTLASLTLGIGLAVLLWPGSRPLPRPVDPKPHGAGLAGQTPEGSPRPAGHGQAPGPPPDGGPPAARRDVGVDRAAEPDAASPARRPPPTRGPRGKRTPPPGLGARPGEGSPGDNMVPPRPPRDPVKPPRPTPGKPEHISEGTLEIDL